MPNLYDFAYAAGLVMAAPVWLIKPSARRKVLGALGGRMARDLPAPPGRPMVMIHAVSVGEVNVVPNLIAELRNRRPELRFVVSTTTETGTDRARQLFASRPEVALIRFPLDFSSAINRVLDRFRPDIAVLMELEVWPNFMCQCRRRSIPVVVANGRITQPSFRRYRRASLFTRGMFRNLAAAAVQDDTYARMFREMGTPDDRVSVLGTMKFDSASLADTIPGDVQLAADVGIDLRRDCLWVCGSTGPGEEQMALDVYRQLLAEHPNLRLAIIPRHPPRFDEVAALISSNGFDCFRRSRASIQRAVAGQTSTADTRPSPIILGDTMGELRKFYTLAAVVFVGRSLVDLGPRQHGSDMIEPAALAKPVIVGPFTGNFDMPVRLLVAANAIAVAADARSLAAQLKRFLQDPSDALATGRRAQDVIRRAQGATARHADLILKLLPSGTE